MAGAEDFKQVVSRVVEAELRPRFAQLESQLAERISESLAGMQSEGRSPGIARLNTLTQSIQQASTQVEILGLLLDSTTEFTGRAAIFVLRAGSFSGWRGRGFARPDIKGIALNSSCPLVQRVLQERRPAVASQDDFDRDFLRDCGPPAQAAKVLLLPLIVREKVAALFYADSSPAENKEIDPAPLECLARFTGLWLEVVAARKAGPAAEQLSKSVEEPASLETSAFSAAEEAIAAVVPAVASGTSSSSETGGEAAASIASSMGFDPAPALTGDISPPIAAVASPAALSREDAEIHQKAQRFARLLVDEIRLYNQRKVEEGRVSGDLYSRLKTEIEKSRAAYDRRYGQSAAASTDYFRQELVRILANNDPALLGRDNSG